MSPLSAAAPWQRLAHAVDLDKIADCSRGSPLLASDAVAKHCHWPVSLGPCCESCLEYSRNTPEPLMLAGSLEVQVLQ